MVISTSGYDDPKSTRITTDTLKSTQPFTTVTTSPISSTSSKPDEDKYKPWEVFGIIILLALIATGICVVIVVKKRR
jgi:ABC-type arginine/histidine transport system permease subunit